MREPRHVERRRRHHAWKNASYGERATTDGSFSNRTHAWVTSKLLNRDTISQKVTNAATWRVIRPCDAREIDEQPIDTTFIEHAGENGVTVAAKDFGIGEGDALGHRWEDVDFAQWSLTRRSVVSAAAIIVRWQHLTHQAAGPGA